MAAKLMIGCYVHEEISAILRHVETTFIGNILNDRNFIISLKDSFYFHCRIERLLPWRVSHRQERA